MEISNYFKEAMPDHLGKLRTILNVVESNAFRCVIMNVMDEREEAEKQIKSMMMKNMKNFSIWQFYGLIKKENK